jgi:hypothetical protein
MAENELSKIIISAAIVLHKNIGPGLLESAYENALAFECTVIASVSVAIYSISSRLLRHSSSQ